MPLYSRPTLLHDSDGVRMIVGVLHRSSRDAGTRRPVTRPAAPPGRWIRTDGNLAVLLPFAAEDIATAEKARHRFRGCTRPLPSIGPRLVAPFSTWPGDQGGFAGTGRFDFLVRLSERPVLPALHSRLGPSRSPHLAHEDVLS